MEQVGLVSGATGLGPRRLLAIAALVCIVDRGVHAVEPASAADVDITADTSIGINLDGFGGVTAEVFPGVTVSNTATLICSSFPSICATTHAWTLTNQGTIGPTPLGNGVFFKAGGAVINAGSIDGSNGIWIEGGTGGSVDNQIGGTIHGKFGAIVIDNVPGMVTNAGSITADGQAVALNDGGILTNLADALIEGHGESNAVAVILGTSREVVNSGTIQSNDTGFATGISLQTACSRTMRRERFSVHITAYGRTDRASPTSPMPA